MDDLADSRVVHLLQARAMIGNDADPSDVTDFAAAASLLLAYHQALRGLIATELAATLGEARQAVCGAQSAKVEVIESFCGGVGLTYELSFLRR